MARRPRTRRSGARWWVALGTAPIGVRIAGLLLTATLSSRRTPRPGAGALIVLGSGLEGDAVSPVLADRLDLAATIHRAGDVAGRPPLIVLSGGAKTVGGSTEAAAMAAYLGSRGVPRDRLLLEDRSTTTRENLNDSATLLAGRPLPSGVVVVTSDFHVWRAATLARRLGLQVQVVGAATELALWVPAVLRELRLLLGEHAWSTALGCAALLSPAVR